MQTALLLDLNQTTELTVSLHDFSTMEMKGGAKEIREELRKILLSHLSFKQITLIWNK